MIIEDVGPKKFKEIIKDKRVYIYGAGRAISNCLDVCFTDKPIEGIIDNNAELQGSSFRFNSLEIPIISVEVFTDEMKRTENMENVVLFVASTIYAGEIIEQLNTIPELEKLHVYLNYLLRNNYSEKTEFEFSEGENRIPKVIHYCWFGGHPIPDHLQKYIDTWAEKCPEYEIVQWNETNYDVKKNRYMRETYESKTWGFVVDYARLDIIYEHGGIYLDTDVELVASLDCMLKDDAYFGFGVHDQINLGIGFGAISKHPLIKELRDFYDDKSFLKPDGSKNMLPCHNYQHPILKDYGFRIVNEYQKINDVVVYPVEVMLQTGDLGLGDFLSDKTVSIHHPQLSWISDKEREGFEKTKKILAQIRRSN